MSDGRTVLTDAMRARVKDTLPGKATESRRHGGGHQAVSRGGALAGPDGTTVARSSVAVRQLQRRDVAVLQPPLPHARIRTAALSFFIAACGLVLCVQPASAEDTPERIASASAVDATSTGTVPYVSVGMSVIRSEGSRFKNSGNRPLYGGGQFDAGRVSGPAVQLAAGVRLPSGLRTQLEFSVARSISWQGNTNYSRSGTRQPSEATLDTLQLLMVGLYDFPGWQFVPGRALRPFLGIGVGITDYRLSDYVQRFPYPDNPDGYLRRGPGGAIPYTGLPGGSGQNFTWMLTAGVGLPLQKNTYLDFGYRFTNAGWIGTDAGNLDLVRYNESGMQREFDAITIDETSAEFRTHSLHVSLRFEL